MVTALFFAATPVITWRVEKSYNSSHDHTLKIKDLNLFNEKCKEFQLTDKQGFLTARGHNIKFKTNYLNFIFGTPEFKYFSIGNLEIFSKLVPGSYIPSNFLSAIQRNDKNRDQISVGNLNVKGIFHYPSTKYSSPLKIQWKLTGNVEPSVSNYRIILEKHTFPVLPPIGKYFNLKEIGPHEISVSFSGKKIKGEVISSIGKSNLKCNADFDNGALNSIRGTITNIRAILPTQFSNFIREIPEITIWKKDDIEYSSKGIKVNDIPGVFSVSGKIKKGFPVQAAYTDRNISVSISGNTFPLLKMDGSFKTQKFRFAESSKGNFRIIGLPRRFIQFTLNVTSRLNFPVSSEDISISISSTKTLLDRFNIVPVKITAESDNTKLSADGKISKNGPEIKLRIELKKNLFSNSIIFSSAVTKGNVSGTWQKPVYSGDLRINNLTYSGMNGTFIGHVIYKDNKIKINGKLQSPMGILTINYQQNVLSGNYQANGNGEHIQLRHKWIRATGNLNFFIRNGLWDLTISSDNAHSDTITLGNSKVTASGNLAGITKINADIKGKSHSLQGRWKQSDKLFKLKIILNNYNFVHTYKNYKISGLITSNLYAFLKTGKFTSLSDFLKNIKKIKGSFTIRGLTLPFYGNVGDININLNETTTGSDFNGKIGNKLYIKGTLSSGYLSGQVTIYGMGMESHLNKKLQKLLSINTRGKVSFSYSKDRLDLRAVLSGFLLRLKKSRFMESNVTIRNHGNIVVTLKKGLMHIESGKFQIAENLFELAGIFSEKKLDVFLKGTMDISLFNPWLPDAIKNLHGTGKFSGTLKGKWSNPVVFFSANLPVGWMTTNKDGQKISLKNTVISLSPSLLTLKTGVRDQRGGTLFAEGKAFLKKYRIINFNSTIHGRLDGSLLSGFFPEEISESSGFARISMNISGLMDKPDISGSLKPENLEIKVRGFNSSFILKKGSIQINSGLMTFMDLGGSYDGGELTANGTVGLLPSLSVELSVKGSNIPFSKREVFHVEANPSIFIKGVPDNMEISGRVDIVNGKYRQNFDIVKHIITAKRYSESSRNIWNTIPWTGDIRLNLSLHNSGDFSVANNIANLQLDGALALEGTLKTPKLKGRVSINSGTFKIPFLRGVYEVETGSVDFDKTRNPFLKLSGTTSIEDNFGDEIMIKLNMNGPLDRIFFNLTSIPDMDQGQILMLLASGKTTQELRKQYHGDPKSGTGTASVNYNPVEMYDQPIKQITGDFLSTLVENPIKMVTKLDAVRFELGSDSFQVKLTKKFLKRISLKSEVEVGFLGKNRQEGTFEVKLHDRVSLDSKVRRYIPDINTYEYEEPLKARIELKYKIRFRGGIRDILGY
ncbi:MAG: translocation/assembly module TamB domain-containing protein [Deltaproteobacteria bacterium]|nr:translocation/assembly module TamB domain-containing protein [Deltaproteobacteria bacterium]